MSTLHLLLYQGRVLVSGSCAQSAPRVGSGHVLGGVCKWTGTRRHLLLVSAVLHCEALNMKTRLCPAHFCSFLMSLTVAVLMACGAEFRAVFVLNTAVVCSQP